MNMSGKLICSVLIPGLILSGGCATYIPRVVELRGEVDEATWLPHHGNRFRTSNDSTLAPAGSRASQGDDGSAVILTAVVACGLLLCLAALSIYLAWTPGGD